MTKHWKKRAQRRYLSSFPAKRSRVLARRRLTKWGIIRGAHVFNSTVSRYCKLFRRICRFASQNAYMPHSLTDTMRTSPAPAEAAAVSLRGGRKKKSYLHFFIDFIQCRTIRLWYFLLSMHHVDSPWIESIVFVTLRNFLSKVDSREPPEAAPAPAAMPGGGRAAIYHHRHRPRLAGLSLA